MVLARIVASRNLAFLCLAGALSAAGCASPREGILVMAHGGNDEWNSIIEQTVAPLREKYPVEIAFGMARTSTLREAVHRLERRGVDRIAVVRMFISGDSFLPQTEYILGLRDDPPQAQPVAHTGNAASHSRHAGHEGHGGPDAHAGHDGHVMEPLEQIPSRAAILVSRNGIGESPLVDEILSDRVRALSVNPAEESVLILAHGPADEAENERWLAHMRLRAQAIHWIGPFRHVQCETLREDWPRRRKEAERRIRTYVKNATEEGGRCIVVPFRVAGFGPYEEVLHGLDYVSDGRGFCPHPNMTRWIEATALECMGTRTVALGCTAP